MQTTSNLLKHLAVAAAVAVALASCSNASDDQAAATPLIAESLPSDGATESLDLPDDDTDNETAIFQGSPELPSSAGDDGETTDGDGSDSPADQPADGDSPADGDDSTDGGDSTDDPGDTGGTGNSDGDSGDSDTGSDGDSDSDSEPEGDAGGDSDSDAGGDLPGEYELLVHPIKAFVSQGCRDQGDFPRIFQSGDAVVVTDSFDHSPTLISQFSTDIWIELPGDPTSPQIELGSGATELTGLRRPIASEATGHQIIVDVFAFVSGGIEIRWATSTTSTGQLQSPKFYPLSDSQSPCWVQLNTAVIKVAAG